MLNFFHAAERMYQRYGWYSSDGLLLLVTRISQYTFDKDDITFQELYETTGRDLIVCATEVEVCRVTYFSHTTHPNTSVVEAIVASASIPLLFQPSCIDGRPYIDGGVLNNFPMNYFISIEEKENSLGLLINSPDDNTGEECMDSFLNYGNRIVYAMLNKIQNLQISQMNSENILTLTVSGINPTEFNIPDEVKNRVINDGYIMTKAFFSRRQSAVPVIDTIRTAFMQLLYKYRTWKLK